MLIIGNAAKQYCLNRIAEQLDTHSEELSILDLGCGTAHAFVQLLRQYSNARYVGIEPITEACIIARENLQGLNATIINSYAYNVLDKLGGEQFDVIVSFSVMEHVYRRQRYIDSIAACLKDDGEALVNYDAGHFIIPAGWKDRAKNVIGPLLALIGVERYYQRFVREEDFRAMVNNANLEIAEVKMLNTYLKGVRKHIPAEHVVEYTQRWLEMELWLNEIGIEYDDTKAKTWLTRNFILRKCTV